MTSDKYRLATQLSLNLVRQYWLPTQFGVHIYGPGRTFVLTQVADVAIGAISYDGFVGGLVEPQDVHGANINANGTAITKVQINGSYGHKFLLVIFQSNTERETGWAQGS